MQKHIQCWVIAWCLVLCVARLNAQVANGRLENGITSVSRAQSIGTTEANSATLQNYAKLPLSFERGGDTEFVARGRGYSVHISGARATIARPPFNTVGIEFVHGRQAIAVAEKELPGKVNYILGNDPRRWRLGLSTYERITYRDVYPGIDVVYYGNQKQLEFDLALKPGADARSIRMRFSGAEDLHTDAAGSLILGDLRLMVPTVIQGKETIEARYKVLGNGEVVLEMGAYDRRRPLLIDPTLLYSTRLGGGTRGNQGTAIALDMSGNAYIAGYTNASDFPVANAAYAGYQANTDGFISKMNSAGTALIYSTYIGGSSYDSLQGIAVDSSGAAWAVGQSESPDFPLLSPYQSSLGAFRNAVVLKLTPSGGLAYSTFLGGPSGAFATSVAVDPFGNAYVAGGASVGFPTTAGVYQSTSQGSDDAFVTKFSSSGSLIWSTFVGGISSDVAYGVAADAFGNSYIAGGTFSPTFPKAPLGGAQAANNGGADAFVAKLNFNASALIYFTFLGGSGNDQAQAISVEPTTGIAVVAGFTNSADLLVSAGALQTGTSGGYHGFVAKLNAAGSAFVYTTYLGGNRWDVLRGVAVDSNGDAYVTGYTDSNMFPTNVPIQSAIQGNSTFLFNTSNTGANWTPFDTNIPGAVVGLSPDPINRGTIIASTDNGTYRTTNNGTTWILQSAAASMNLSRSLANAATIYGSSGSAIYQSTDDGVTWYYKGSVPQCCIVNITADPIDAATLYAIVAAQPNPDTGYVINGNAIEKSVDSGATWNAVNTGLPVNASVSAMAAASDGTLYVGLSYSPGLSPGGVYRSTDHGATWVGLSNGLHTNFGVPQQGLVVAATNPSVVYVTDYFTLSGSTDRGTSWSTIGALPGGTNAIAVSSTNPATLYYATYYSTAPLWVSTDSGVTWNPSAGLGVASVSRIVPDPLNAMGAYALVPVDILPIVAKIDAAGKNLLYSTYLGDFGGGYGIATNGVGDAFVTGSTWEFPTTPPALQRNRNIYYNNLDGFVARISDATAACSYSVDPQQSLEVWYTHIVQYVVTAPSGCPWTASSSQAWATIVSGAAGSGSGIVYVLANNTAATTQSATLAIAGQSVTLRQRAVAGCGYNSFSPEASVVPGGGGTVQFNVIVGAGCDWTLATNEPTAVTIPSGASGTGNGTVTLVVSPNLGSNARTLTVYSQQGDMETISQAGTTAPAVVATVTSSPSGASISVIGSGCIPGTFTTPASLTWNANTNCTVVFTTPQVISGASYVFNSATINGGSSTTTNPLTVNSGSGALTINANFMNPCSYSLSPSGQGFSASGGLGSFAVTTASACSWKAVPSAGWISILPSGTHGTAKVHYTVAANSSSASRTGIISVGGQKYNIDQAGFSCSYSISPTFASLDDTGGNVAVSVSAPSGCAWTAVSNAPWLTVSSGAYGSGGGGVVLNIAPNTGGTPRSGTATIAGQTFSVSQGAGACGALDVTSQVSVMPSSLTPIGFGSTLFQQTITVRSGPIKSPVYLVLIGEPTYRGNLSDSFLLGGGAVTSCFSSPGDFLVLVGDLSSGGVVGIPLVWTIQPFGRIAYTVKVLSGTPSH